MIPVNEKRCQASNISRKFEIFLFIKKSNTLKISEKFGINWLNFGSQKLNNSYLCNKIPKLVHSAALDTVSICFVTHQIPANTHTNTRGGVLSLLS